MRPREKPSPETVNSQSPERSNDPTDGTRNPENQWRGVGGFVSKKGVLELSVAESPSTWGRCHILRRPLGSVWCLRHPFGSLFFFFFWDTSFLLVVLKGGLSFVENPPPPFFGVKGGQASHFFAGVQVRLHGQRLQRAIHVPRPGPTGSSGVWSLRQLS